MRVVCSWSFFGDLGYRVGMYCQRPNAFSYGHVRIMNAGIVFRNIQVATYWGYEGMMRVPFE